MDASESEDDEPLLRKRKRSAGPAHNETRKLLNEMHEHSQKKQRRMQLLQNESDKSDDATHALHGSSDLGERLFCFDKTLRQMRAIRLFP